MVLFVHLTRCLTGNAILVSLLLHNLKIVSLLYCGNLLCVWMSVKRGEMYAVLKLCNTFSDFGSAFLPLLDFFGVFLGCLSAWVSCNPGRMHLVFTWKYKQFDDLKLAATKKDCECLEKIAFPYPNSVLSRNEDFRKIWDEAFIGNLSLDLYN